MAREYRIIAAVGKTSVPVPPALGLCTDLEVNDAPFYVMGHVDGVVLDSAERAAALPRELRVPASEHLVHVLADLHAVDIDAIGLGDLARREGYIERQLKRWSDQWERSKTRELPSIDRVRDALSRMLPAPLPTTIAHGDYRLSNCMMSPNGAVAGVLDWELCTLGEPMADVGGLLGYWFDPNDPDEGGDAMTTGLPGFLSAEEMAGLYAQQMKVPMASVSYYRAFAQWRLACIGEGVLARYLAGQQGEQGETMNLDAYRDAIPRRAAKAARLLGIAV